MVKKYSLKDYLDGLISESKQADEDEFMIIQNRIHKNILKDIESLEDNLVVNDIPPPIDFVFMIYFSLLWDKVAKFCDDTQQEKLKDNIKGAFEMVMENPPELQKIIRH